MLTQRNLVTRFINDFRGVAHEPNVKFSRNGNENYRYKGVIFKGRVVVVACRDIAEDEELLVDYGIGYCKKWKIGDVEEKTLHKE